MNAHQWFSALLDVVGSQPTGAEIRQCPAHADSSPSLSIRSSPDGRPWIRCFGGCDLNAILLALRCDRSRLRKPPPFPPEKYAAMVKLKIEFPKVEVRRGSPESRGFRLEARHDYGPAVLFRWRSRSGSKELAWETRTANGGLVPGLFGITLADLPLYREAEIRRAVALGEPVLLVESESSTDGLKGFYSTTWAGGADAVNIGRLTQVLGGYPNTVVIPDNDPAGRRWYARAYAARLAPAVLWPDEGTDARDLYAQLGHDRFGQAVHASLRGGYQRKQEAA
ncbi:hypothetical protein ACN27G_27665 [Plantactinospora sp. WMMB334]|uniref:hypothetical protein n=1 Tax=Plantactinospora sp. WMMB334 TaxID=3404119 RepID=UPI003B947C11